MAVTVEQFLASYPEEIRIIALCSRELILELIPNAVELVDPPSKIIAYGSGTRYKDLVCAIAPYPGHVNIMLSQGALLADPEQILQGSGKKARHIRLMTLDDVERPAVRRLIESAAQYK